MFTLIKEFNQEREVANLKRAIEENPEIASCATEMLIDRPGFGRHDSTLLKNHWQKHDTGWSLATCISVAEFIDSFSNCYKSDEDYIKAFMESMDNSYWKLPGCDPVLMPRLIYVIWVQHLMHHHEMAGILSRKRAGEGYPEHKPSTLTIWSANDDRAFVVTNALNHKEEVLKFENGEYVISRPHMPWRHIEEEFQRLKLFPSEGYLLFDPESGLYHTEKKLTDELNKIEDSMEKMRQIILAYAPDAKDLSLYCTGRVAEGIISNFMLSD